MRSKRKFVFKPYKSMEDKYASYRRKSLGWQYDPSVKVHPRIIFGPGFRLTKEYAKTYNITHVINCADETSSPAWFKLMHPKKYACLHAEDSPSANILNWYSQFETIMQSFLKAPDANVIFVHCQAGVNRSGFLTLAFLCLHFGYDYEITVKSILKQRPCALLNPAYQIQVEKRCAKE